MDSVVIDNDINNYTLTSLHPATEYEIKLNAVRGSQESKVITTTVFTGISVLAQLLRHTDHIYLCSAETSILTYPRKMSFGVSFLTASFVTVL